MHELIRERIIERNEKVCLIDCKNSINQYMFNRDEIDVIKTNLFVARIEQPYDLLDYLKRIHLNNHYKESSLLIITDYTHMLDIRDKETVENNIKKAIEKLKKEVVVWDTRFRQSAR